jgi:hypothetical protein
VVCNSDDHKGRPGASFPGASVFGAYGGLTCFLMPDNTRDDVFEAIRSRHTYGTSGVRAFIDMRGHFAEGGEVYTRDPLTIPGAVGTKATECMMGDIVRINGSKARISLAIHAPVGIVSVELRDGTKVLRSDRTYDEADLGRRVRVMWSGAEYRGRGRNTHWRGRADFSGVAIRRFSAVNRFNPEMPLSQVGSSSVVWNSVTTGNMMGFDAWMSATGGTLDIRTGLGDTSADLDSMGLDAHVMNAGGLERKLTVQRFPDGALPRTFSLESEVDIAASGDTPIWICVTFEDGNQAWTSPIYFHRD